MAGSQQAGVRTVGVEEELLLVDPDTGRLAGRAPQVLATLRGNDSEGDSEDVDHELFRHQLETRTDPATDLGAVGEQLVAARRSAGEAAAATGVALVAVGVPPLPGEEEPRVTRDDRYLDMIHTYGAVAREMGTCAMHVHVGIESDEEGVAAIDALAPWLPVVLALSANSPYHDGADTGYASWRAQVWSRWPSAGPTEPFGTPAGYRAAAELLMELGSARDEGMLYFDARLSAGQPTVEVRVPDTCTDPDDALLVAALVRGLVTTATAGELRGPEQAWRVDALRAAQWRASRYGVAEGLVDPVLRSVRPARDVVEALVTAVHASLAEAGDLERVAEGVERVLAGGGAARQRAAYERSGDVRGVVDDLAARTAASWA